MFVYPIAIRRVALISSLILITILCFQGTVSSQEMAQDYRDLLESTRTISNESQALKEMGEEAYADIKAQQQVAPSGEGIGVVKYLKGKATAQATSASRILDEGSSVQQGETILTGPDTTIEIQFADGTILSQGSNSQIELDTYVYDALGQDSALLFQMAKGTFRTVTGEIVKQNPDRFKIQSPLATIGIRGTTMGHLIGGDQETHMVLAIGALPHPLPGPGQAPGALPDPLPGPGQIPGALPDPLPGPGQIPGALPDPLPGPGSIHVIIIDQFGNVRSLSNNMLAVDIYSSGAGQVRPVTEYERNLINSLVPIQLANQDMGRIGDLADTILESYHTLLDLGPCAAGKGAQTEACQSIAEALHATAQQSRQALELYVASLQALADGDAAASSEYAARADALYEESATQRSLAKQSYQAYKTGDYDQARHLAEASGAAARTPPRVSSAASPAFSPLATPSTASGD